MSDTQWVLEPVGGYPPPVTAPTPTRVRPARWSLTLGHWLVMDAAPETRQRHFIESSRSDRPTREREESIQWVIGGLRAGWVPDTSGLDRADQARAGYLTTLLYLVGPTPNQGYRDAFAAAIPAKVDLDGPVCWPDGEYFPRGRDDLARSWGLYNGINLARLQQIIDTGSC